MGHAERHERQAAFEFMGEELRRLRTEANLSQEDLGLRLCLGDGMIGHFEAGRRKPNLEQAQLLDLTLDTGGFFHRWRRWIDEGHFPDHFRAAAELEETATEIRLFGLSLVPGILQTTDYAYAVLLEGAANPATVKMEIELKLAGRSDRARVLDRPDPPVVWAMLDEAVLRRRVGGGAVMGAQLRHIAALGRAGRVRVHILPFAQGAHPLIESLLVLMAFNNAPSVAYVEGLRTGHLMDDPASVTHCNTAYALALGQALPVEASLALLIAAAEEHERADGIPG
ncbi:helix-turn-helix domain-containing protein [Streptomyces uncialis]|uniref:HTH cro/C1-type domain-containing protein n=1 Tax=Streptomyces uncialis TaxID=1048205 RepID=A0A1Q4V0I5_9ACTN|nr:helix-turn-helix transcriptional regulator [Streptomyces uncialis]OKH91343.1 hypothetical protein AB852_30885 [Streptomyces uncialis]WTE10749.1 helix-turn-helix transcriptional regulator [Streptomyces uncialis]